MSINDDHLLTLKEQSEISKRIFEMDAQKKLKKTDSLSDLKEELNIPEKGKNNGL